MNIKSSSKVSKREAPLLLLDRSHGAIMGHGSRLQMQPEHIQIQIVGLGVVHIYVYGDVGRSVWPASPFLAHAGDVGV